MGMLVGHSRVPRLSGSRQGGIIHPWADSPARYRFGGGSFLNSCESSHKRAAFGAGLLAHRKRVYLQRGQLHEYRTHARISHRAFMYHLVHLIRLLALAILPLVVGGAGGNLPDGPAEEVLVFAVNLLSPEEWTVLRLSFQVAACAAFVCLPVGVGVGYLLARGRFAGKWLVESVTVPLARRGLIAGWMLAFARSLEEFGVTIMLTTNTPGQHTIPLEIYSLTSRPEGIDQCWRLVMLSVVLDTAGGVCLAPELRHLGIVFQDHLLS